ncbi:MAG: YqeG family HAD IIIA-type phosphatase [Ruminococcaceae bacterium]|nr:YqeG family HAD IIIA-type phosphatase [Oscillospiraceae bacterium]
MKHLLIPDLICDTVYDIPFSDYYEKGIRAIAFDIDNTLVSYDTPEPDEKLTAFLFSLRDMGFSIAFVSNNDASRVERFNASLGFSANPDAHKPLTGCLKKVMKKFGVKKSEFLMVGDQLLTDALCARLAGVAVVTVPPIQPVENRFFRLKRRIEKPFIRAYYKKQGRKK